MIIGIIITVAIILIGGLFVFLVNRTKDDTREVGVC